MKKNKNTKQLGFTLIELLVAITIFGIFIAIGASSLVDIMKQDQKVSVLRKVQEDTRYILESIAREARNANGELNAAGERIGLAYSVDNGKLTIINTDRLAKKVTKKEYSTVDIAGGFKNIQLISSEKDIGGDWPTNVQPVVLNNSTDVVIKEFTPAVSNIPDPTADPLKLVPPKLDIKIVAQSNEKKYVFNGQSQPSAELTTAVSPRNY